MCVPVLPAVAVGLSLFQGLAMRSAAQDEARQIAKTERQNMVRADESASKQVTAEGQKLSATQASEAQKAQRRRIAGIENIGKVKTLEGKGGNLMASLLMNEGRKTGDEINTINQSLNWIKCKFINMRVESISIFIFYIFYKNCISCFKWCS